jgi:hypothetical protein
LMRGVSASLFLLSLSPLSLTPLRVTSYPSCFLNHNPSVFIAFHQQYRLLVWQKHFVTYKHFQLISRFEFTRSFNTLVLTRRGLAFLCPFPSGVNTTVFLLTRIIE